MEVKADIEVHQELTCKHDCQPLSRGIPCKTVNTPSYTGKELHMFICECSSVHMHTCDFLGTPGVGNTNEYGGKSSKEEVIFELLHIFILS